MTHRPIRIGTRASRLAQWQANWVAEQLAARDHASELVLMTTTGDERSRADRAVSGTGLFTKEIQAALVGREVDVAVHSLKDLPTQPTEGLMVVAIPRRASPFDVVVSRHQASWDQLVAGSRIGTSSPRRVAQLRHARGDLEFVEIRGNVDTRLRKLDDAECDALVLAEAGLQRLGLASRISQRLEPELCLPAAGQGALAIEIRAADRRRLAILDTMNDRETAAATTAERAFLAAVEAGCRSPAGAWCRLSSANRLLLDATVLDTEGREKISVSVEGELSDAAALGGLAAEKAWERGADRLI